MSKIEWGIKRRCHDCAAPFYDLRREPIHCPKCGSLFRPQPATARSGAGARRLRGRAGHAQALLAVAPAAAVDAVEDQDDAVDEAEADEAEADEADAEDRPEDEDDDEASDDPADDEGKPLGAP